MILCDFLSIYLAVNVSNNAGNVSALDRQKLGKYSAGSCECVIHYVFIDV